MAEKESPRQTLKRLRGRERIQFLYDYFKLPIGLGLCAVLLLTGAIYKRVTRREALLHVVLINIVDDNEALLSYLTDGYLEYVGADRRRTEVDLVSGLYLSDDPSDPNASYAYTSGVKLMAMIDAEQVDVVLASRPAMDLIQEAGYLAALPDGNLEQEVDITVFGYSEAAYAGIVANAPERGEAEGYLTYLSLP